jgi:hypothetical protein
MIKVNGLAELNGFAELVGVAVQMKRILHTPQDTPTPSEVIRHERSSSALIHESIFATESWHRVTPFVHCIELPRFRILAWWVALSSCIEACGVLNACFPRRTDGQPCQPLQI